MVLVSNYMREYQFYFNEDPQLPVVYNKHLLLTHTNCWKLQAICCDSTQPYSPCLLFLAPRLKKPPLFGAWDTWGRGERAQELVESVMPLKAFTHTQHMAPLLTACWTKHNTWSRKGGSKLLPQEDYKSHHHGWACIMLSAGRRGQILGSDHIFNQRILFIHRVSRWDNLAPSSYSKESSPNIGGTEEGGNVLSHTVGIKDPPVPKTDTERQKILTRQYLLIKRVQACTSPAEQTCEHKMANHGSSLYPWRSCTCPNPGFVQVKGSQSKRLGDRLGNTVWP
jgi:hypothetical protein